MYKIVWLSLVNLIQVEWNIVLAICIHNCSTRSCGLYSWYHSSFTLEHCKLLLETYMIRTANFWRSQLGYALMPVVFAVSQDVPPWKWTVWCPCIAISRTYACRISTRCWQPLWYGYALSSSIRIHGCSNWPVVARCIHSSHSGCLSGTRLMLKFATRYSTRQWTLCTVTH